MSEFNKEQFFKDTEEALRNEDMAAMENENSKLIAEMTEDEQIELFMEMCEYIVAANEREQNKTLEEFIEFCQDKIARYFMNKLAEALEEQKEEVKDSSGEKEGQTVTEKDTSDTTAAKVEETQDTNASEATKAEGTAPAEEAKAE